MMANTTMPTSLAEQEVLQEAQHGPAADEQDVELEVEQDAVNSRYTEASTKAYMVKKCAIPKGSTFNHAASS